MMFSKNIYTVAVATALLSVPVVNAQTTDVVDEIADTLPEQLGLSEECSSALQEMANDMEITGAQQMFITDLLSACTDEDKMECSFDLGVSGVSISMDACNMPQLGEYQMKCEAPGTYTFCSMSAEISASVNLEDYGFGAPVTIKPSCIGICIPTACDPMELENMSPFQFTLDYVADQIEEVADNVADIDIEITETSVDMSFDCLEPGDGVMVEEKGSLRFRM